MPPASPKTQSSDASFKCEHCGRGFLFKNNLKTHIRTHTRDRWYTCDLCQNSFNYKESLKNHMLLHSNLHPYLCEICGRKFRDRSNRRKHVKNVHKYVINPNVGEVSASVTSSSSSCPTTQAGGHSHHNKSYAHPPSQQQRQCWNIGEYSSSVASSVGDSERQQHHYMVDSSSSSLDEYSHLQLSHHPQSLGSLSINQGITGQDVGQQFQQRSALDGLNANFPISTTIPTPRTNSASTTTNGGTGGNRGDNAFFHYKDLSQFDFSYF